MEALPAFAVAGNSGSHDLGKSVDIKGLYPKPLLHLLSHLIRPGLRAADRVFKLYLINQTLFLKCFRHMEKIAAAQASSRIATTAQPIFRPVCQGASP